MANKKLHILVYKNGMPIGYIKNISYTTGKFNITKVVTNAKGYASDAHIQNEIEKLSLLGNNAGFTFFITV